MLRADVQFEIRGQLHGHAFAAVAALASMATVVPAAMLLRAAVLHHNLFGRQIRHAQRITEGLRQRFELQNFFRIGRFVDPAQAGNGARFQELRDGLIGGQHEFLDQSVRDIAHAAADVGHTALFIEVNHRLGQIKINRAAPVTPRIQDQRQFAHVAEVRGQRRVALAQFRIAFQHLVDVGVRHPLGRTDHPRREAGSQHRATRVKFHHRAHHQAVHFRIQRADTVGKSFGQHGHSAVGEVHAGSAEARLAVKRRAAAHVMRHIGDMHLQLIAAAGQRFHVDRVVEVAGGFAINGDDRQRAEILAALEIGGLHLLGGLFCFFAHLRGEAMRQMMLADDDFHIGADIAGTAKNFHHAARAVHSAFGEARQLHVHHGALEFGNARRALLRINRQLFRAHAGAQNGRQLLARRNHDLLLDTRFVGQHRITAQTITEDAHHRGVRALHHPGDRGFRAPIGPMAQNAHRHRVAVHGITDIFRVDEQITRHVRHGLIQHHKTVAITMRD